ncbi:MAG: CARDB domain-containing protein [Methanomicrobiales archaeon]
MKPTGLALILLFIGTSVLVMGCSSLNNVQDYNQGIQTSQVQSTLLKQSGDWGITRGCYYTVQYQVFNTGTIPAKNVRLGVMLVHINDAAVRDSRDIYIGTLAPGASTTVSVELDGECLKDYNVRAVPAYDI